MPDERQDQNTADTGQDAVPATDELKDLSPLENESDTVTGGSGGWNRVKNDPDS